MQCLMTYKWVKLLRSHLPEGKGLMGYWAKLASHAAFRKGQALYCGHYNRVAPGMWSGGMVGLKRILGLRSRQSVIDVMNQLMDLGFITYTIDAKTKKLEYFLCDWIENCSGEACLGVTAYAIYYQRQSELIANCQYDILNYEGDIAAWDEMIAVYAVKLNLGDEPQEVATFDEDKAVELKEIFWDMNTISLRTETQTNTIIQYETDTNGNLVEVQEKVTMIILTIVTDSMSVNQIANEYGFSARQNEILDELLSEENAELWAGILGE